MSRQGRVRLVGTAAEPRPRTLYARMLRLRQLNPSGMLCFVFFEGAVIVGLLLALAELVSWWVMLVLPTAVSIMVKANDVVAAAVARSAARVPEQEQERFRREVWLSAGRTAEGRGGVGTLRQPGRHRCAERSG